MKPQSEPSWTYQDIGPRELRRLISKPKAAFTLIELLAES